MEIQATNYYNTSKHSNVFYFNMMEVEKFFANNLFRGNLTRVFYASENYAFRQRLNLLSMSGEPSSKELQFPFLSYFRLNNVELSNDFPGVQGTSSALYGVFEEDLGINIRWLQTKTVFTAVAFFASDLDSQIFQEALLFIKHPAGPRQWVASGLEYKGIQISIPIQLFIDAIQYNPQYLETDWLKKHRIFPIKFQFTVRSVTLSQLPQGPESTVFFEDEPPIITKKVVLDFFAYKFSNQYFDKDHTDFEVTGTFNPDFTLGGSLTIDEAGTSDTTIKVDWDYNPVLDQEWLDPPTNTIPNPDYGTYEDDVLLVLNGVIETHVPRITKTYTYTGLQNESLYNVTIWFIKKTGEVTKYVASETTTTETHINLKGMIGYKY